MFKAVLVLAACFAITPFVMAACSGPQTLEAQLRAHPDADTYTTLGNWFGDHNQFDCADEAYSAGLKLEPGSAKLSYLVGLSLLSAGNPKDAVAPLQQSIQLMPEVLRPHLILAAAFDQLQRKDEAKAEFEAALRIDPHSQVALDALAKYLIAEGNFPAAISVLRSSPQDEDMTLDLARAYASMHMFDDASKILTEALHAHPSSLPITTALTDIFVSQSRYQDAAVITEKAARLRPRDLAAQRLYLRVLVLNSDLVKARPLGRRLLAQAPHDFDFLYLNGILEHEAGQNTIAYNHLEQAIVLNPNHYNARYNLGLVLAELNRPAEAREQFEKAIALGAKEPEVRFKLAAVLRTLGETQLAQEQLKLYQQELQEAANRSLAAGKAVQAAKEMSGGDPQKAVTLYREAIQATPQDALLNFKLALALDRTGDTAAEQAALEDALKIDPTLALAQNQMGYLASKSGDFPTAEQHFRLAVKSAPGYGEAWINLAATLGMESRFPEAIQAVETAIKLDPQNAQALQLRQSLNSAQSR
jgi:tetratricopeptide (TPR) repeat protein